MGHSKSNTQIVKLSIQSFNQHLATRSNHFQSIMAAKRMSTSSTESALSQQSNVESCIQQLEMLTNVWDNVKIGLTGADFLDLLKKQNHDQMSEGFKAYWDILGRN